MEAYLKHLNLQIHESSYITHRRVNSFYCALNKLLKRYWEKLNSLISVSQTHNVKKKLTLNQKFY